MNKWVKINQGRYEYHSDDAYMSVWNDRRDGWLWFACTTPTTFIVLRAKHGSITSSAAKASATKSLKAARKREGV